MATLTLQRASWCLQISRTSRTFAVSFTTSLPRNGKPRHLPQDSSSPLRQSSRSVHPSRDDAARRSTRNAETRRAFTSTRFYRAQQQAGSPASKFTPLDVEPYESPGTLSPDTPNLTSGLNDQNIVLDESTDQVDWSRSFHGLSTEAFSPEAAKALLAPLEPEDIEVKPDGILYLPEIKYRRILNQAFGPGGWGLAPRGETIVTSKAVTREYALVALGRLVSVARGEQDYFTPEGITTAVEGCKSTALRRCCKDLGVASELWDPRFIRKFMAQHVKEVFAEHQTTKKRKKMYLRKDDTLKYPYKEVRYGS
ncbi:mitochondrial genome maintenance MGM101-domain-containing protein [Usnea florida]